MKYKLLPATVLGFLTAMFVASYSATSTAHHLDKHIMTSYDFNVVDKVRIDIESAVRNRDTVLMMIGTAVYYQDNCAGLTHVGKRYLNKAIDMHRIDVRVMHTDKNYKVGVRLAKGYPSCNKLRFAITDVGLGMMIR
jgi:hypothetical protein